MMYTQFSDGQYQQYIVIPYLIARVMILFRITISKILRWKICSTK